MKGIKLFIITAILFAITSCSKEEQEIENGFVKMENKISNLNYGYIDKRLSNQQIRIHLSDKKIIFQNQDEWELGSRDNHILLIIWYPNPETQNLADYYPLITGEERNTTTLPYLSNSVVTFNITKTTNEITHSNFEYRNILWDNGSLTIDSINNNFKITFTLKENGQMVTGEYYGNLEDISF